jgi:hypothetical protein
VTERAETQTRWSARPLQAALLRTFAFLAPIAASILFVQLASRLVAAPRESFWLHVGWWVLLTGAATGVLVLVDRLSRRLLPLAALYRLSLVFPDRAPSRFRVAMRSGSVATLEERVDRARRGTRETTPVEAAERLLALVAALDVHDRLTRGHSERVRAYAQMIGRELRLQKHELDLLNWAALVHDVGKLDVPTEILTKPGKLTDDEWAAIRRHPELGERLVAPLRGWLGEWATAVRDHHERWDGAGYPDGKAAEEISLAGRIVAVADVFDVITSTRSYKAAGSAVDGRSEIARCAGTQFDPGVVRAFLGISLGRSRIATGPLSWLVHAPLLGRLPLAPSLGSVAGSAAVVATAVGGGLMVGSPVPTPPVPSPAAAAVVHEAAVRRSVSAPAAREAPAVAVRTKPKLPNPQRAAEPPRTGAPLAGAADDAPPAAPKPTAAAPPEPPPAAGTLDAPSFTIEIDEDSAVRVPLAGVTGSDGVTSLNIVAPPAAGEAAATGSHELLYTPPVDFHGSAAVGYEACWQDAACAGGEIGITVRPINDAPVAAADEATGKAGALVTVPVLANDSDVDGDRLGVARVDQPPAGAASTDGAAITYRPPPGFAGRAAFTYTVADPKGGSATGSVVVTVDSARVDGAPTAVDDKASVPANTSVVVDVLANDTDPEGDALAIATVGRPSAGSAVAGAKGVEFTPPSGFSGSATFGYTVADPAGGTDEGVVSVEVLRVNAPPTFELGPDQTVPEDAGPQAVKGFASSISPGPAEEAAQSVRFVVSSSKPGLFAVDGQPAISPTGELTFTPASNANGTATVTVKAVDDGGTANGGVDRSAPQTFLVTVTPVNDPPVATADAVSLDEDDPDGVTFSVVTNDTDVDAGDVLTLDSYDAAGVVRGELVDLGGGSFTYVPGSGTSGIETFTYVVSDGQGGTDAGAVTIDVAPLADPPEAADDAYVIVEGATLVEAAPGLVANDADQDGDPLTATLVAGPTSGALALAPDGGFTYAPDIGFSGTDTFTYRVEDGTGAADTASVVITVSASVSAATFYLQPSGPSADLWDLGTTPPPASLLVPDHDGDGTPGLWIKHGDGDESTSDPRQWQEWAYTTPAPLVLNGPVTLQLWSTIELFELDREGHPYVYLYDCAAGGTGCTLIAQNDVHVNEWNGLLPTWVFNEITVGSVSRTIGTGRELRVCLHFGHDDLWVALTAAYPSALTVTLG